jgi:hypothetical protein
VLSALGYFQILNGIQLFCAVMVLIPLLAVIFLRRIGKDGIYTGIAAIATITKCDTANFILSGGERSKSFVLKMEVSVTNDNGESWQTKMIEHIADFQAAQFQPGFKFKVVYDENNRNKVKASRSVIDNNTIEVV